MDLLQQFMSGSSTSKLQSNVQQILKSIPPDIITQVLQQPTPTKQSLSILHDIASDTKTGSPLNVLLHLFPLKKQQQQIAQLVTGYIKQQGGIDLQGKENLIEPLVLQSLLKLFWNQQGGGGGNGLTHLFLNQLGTMAQRYIQRQLPDISNADLTAIRSLLNQLITPQLSPELNQAIHQHLPIRRESFDSSSLSKFQFPSNDPVFQHILTALFNANDIHLPFSTILQHITASDFQSQIEADDKVGITVINRMTQEKEKEQIDWWLIVIFRLLYSPDVLKKILHITGDTDVDGLKKIFRNLTLFAGRYYNTPASAKNIKGTIAKYQLDTSEFLQSVSSFKTYNEFFHRQLKPNARSMAPMIAAMPSVITSPADCRITVFPSVNVARRLWVKGSEFSVRSLVESAELSQPFQDDTCSVAICRLAPQDYHRFHHFVDGKVTAAPRTVGDAYLTVNPLAVNSTAFNVFTENKRVVFPVNSAVFGPCVCIVVGATMVGSISMTKPKTGQANVDVKRGEEMGYFSFGGSTIILLFQKDKVSFWPDLVRNSDEKRDGGTIETVIKVGQPIGTSPDYPLPADLPFMMQEMNNNILTRPNSPDKSNMTSQSFIQQKSKQWLGSAFDDNNDDDENEFGAF